MDGHQPLRITWIAPVIPNLPQLAWLEELGRLQMIPGIIVTTLTGSTFTKDDVAKTLGLPADVVIWSGHGQAGELLVPDGQTVKTKWFAVHVVKARPRLVILAACASGERNMDLRSITEAVCRAGICVVGFPARADDKAAGLFTIECVRALAGNASIGDAFDVALDEIGGSTAVGILLMPGLLNVPFFIEITLANMNATLERIEATINGRTVQVMESGTVQGGGDGRSNLQGISGLARSADRATMIPAADPPLDEPASV